MPEQPPLISIVIPAYNSANFIAETIDSVRQQTYSNWELIIVDDGSKDHTEESIRKIIDHRIFYIKTGHTGMDHARNTGLNNAKGDYIALLDSDDLWDRTKLEKQLSVFAQYPEAEFCLTGGYDFITEGNPTDLFYNQKKGLKYGDLFLSFFKSQLAALPSALLFRSTALKKTGLLKETPLAHVEFILKLAKTYKGIILYEPLAFRRVHHNNYSIINKAKRHRDGINMIHSYKSLLSPYIYKDCLFKSQINFATGCLHDSGKRTAIKQFIKAWQYKPYSIVPLKKITKAVLSIRHH